MGSESAQGFEERSQRARTLAAPFERDTAMVLVVGSDCRLLYASAGCAEIFDTPQDAWTGKALRDVLAVDRIPAEDVDVLENVCRRTGSDLAPILFRYEHAVGGRRWLEGRVYRAEGEDAARGHAQTLVLLHDATSRWRDLSAVFESEKRFRTLASATRDMVTETDSKGRFIYVSSACAEVLGYEPADLVGTAPVLLHHENDLGTFLDELRAGAKTGESIEVSPHRLRHRDGSWVWVEAAAVRYRHSDGGYRTLGVAWDITSRVEAERERRDLEEQLLRTQKLESLGILSGGIAHDFNNLLTPIIGNADLTAKELPDGSPLQVRVERIRVAAERAAALTQQMLAYAGQSVIHSVVVDLSKIVQDMALLLESTASQIEYDFDPHTPMCRADEAQIGQVLMNLVSNAAESLSASGGRIDVRTGCIQASRVRLDASYMGNELEEGTYAYLEVADNGSGIDPEARERIFDPFFTTKFTGRGLGLATVIGVVRAHHGTLEIESECGSGTTFRVLLPAAVGEPLPAPAARDAEPSTPLAPGGTLLVIDDDEGARDFTATLLERAGFDVLTAADGPAGIDLFRRHCGELAGVILDCTMPRMSGADVFDALRKLQPDTRVVLLSGYSIERVAESLSERGLFGFLQKPFLPEDLLRVVGRLVEHRGE